MDAMASFYVYDNSDADYSKVHRAGCEHCKDGTGHLGHRVGPGDQFIAATTLDEAERRAKALGRKKWDHCAVCKPQLSNGAA